MMEIQKNFFGGFSIRLKTCQQPPAKPSWSSRVMIWVSWTQSSFIKFKCWSAARAMPEWLHDVILWIINSLRFFLCWRRLVFSSACESTWHSKSVASLKIISRVKWRLFTFMQIIRSQVFFVCCCWFHYSINCEHQQPHKTVKCQRTFTAQSFFLLLLCEHGNFNRARETAWACDHIGNWASSLRDSFFCCSRDVG